VTDAGFPIAPITATTRVVAVIGAPVRHSLSPALHNAAFESAGLDWRCVAFEVAPGAAADAITAMRTLGIGGLAVTTPHKADVAAAVDEVDPSAASLRSVNTVVLRDDGSTLGLSTDGDGFAGSLEASGIAVEGLRVVVLGAGGAARSIVDALGRRGAAEVVVVNRDRERGEQTASLAAQARPGSAADIDDADVLVNATSVGMGSDEMPVDPGLLHAGLTVVDIVYHPLDTALLRAASAVGAGTLDGLGMLVHQAVLQQRAWTGVAPDPGLLRRVAEAELASRAAGKAR
jgi:shikimate dehydrogenase